MAYMNQERKAKIAARLKAVVPKGWKYTLAVRHHSSIVFNLKEAPVDLLQDYFEVAKQRALFRMDVDPQKPQNLDVNPYWYKEHFSPEVAAQLTPIFDALNLRGDEGANHDNSDIMTDYFDVGWYVDFNIGQWDKPFKVTQEAVPA